MGLLARVNSFTKGGLLFCNSSVVGRRYVSFISSKAVIDSAAKDGELRMFIVAGEVSGDSIGARLMGSVKKLCPFPVLFRGVGGSMMSQHGLQSLFPMEDLSVMGIWELLPHLYKFRARLKETVEDALSFKPHVVVTIDSKGFSFRLLKELRASYCLHGLDSPTHFHYVAPSFWAWKGGEARLKGLSQFVDHMFCILPFEEDTCRSNGLAATFVGHPVLEDCVDLHLGKDTADWKIPTNSKDFRNKFNIRPGAKVISLLPGSRLQEVNRMLPIFLKTLEILSDSLPELRVVLHVASNRDVEDYVSKLAHHWPVPVVQIPGSSTGLKYDAFSASTVALCTSGTVALELQLARLPCAVTYRAHIITECFIRYKANVPYISLPNVLLDSPVIPEALFRACTPRYLAPMLLKLIEDEGLRGQQFDSSAKVARLLCPPEKNFGECDWEGGPSLPSMVAASTLLHYRRAR